MYVSVQSKTIQLTKAMRQFAEAQVSKLIERQSRIQGITFFLEKIAKKKNDIWATRVKMQVKVPGHDILVEKKALNMYSAIKQASHRALAALNDLKRKRLHFKRATPHQSRLSFG